MLKNSCQKFTNFNNNSLRQKKRGGAKRKKKNDRRKGTNDATYLVEYSLWFETHGEGGIGRESVMYYCAQGQSRRWHIGDWFLAYRVLRGFSRGSHVGYPIPPPSPPPIKIRSVIIGMSRDIFRPSFMYEAPITIGRRIIETSASIDRQPRYRQLLRPCADSNVRALEKMRRHPLLPPSYLFQISSRLSSSMDNLRWTPFWCAYPWDTIFFFLSFSHIHIWVRLLCRSKFCARYFIFLVKPRIYIFFRTFREEWKRKIKIWR